MPGPYDATAVHVALAPPSPSPHLAEVLDADERARAGALGAPCRAARSVTAAALTRLLLSSLTGTPATAFTVVRRCVVCGDVGHGRPQLAEGPWHVSRSSTAGLVAVAVTRVGAVGVDVERGAATDFPGFGGVALGPGEQAGSPGQRARTWTRKEALLKAAGVGLSQDPRQVQVGPPGDSPRVVAWPAAPGPAQLLDVPSPHGTACSVAVLSAGPVVLRLGDAQALLRQ